MNDAKSKRSGAYLLMFLFVTPLVQNCSGSFVVPDAEVISSRDQRLKAEGRMMISDDIVGEIGQESLDGSMQASKPNYGVKWTNGRVPIRTTGLTAAQRAMIFNACNAW